MEGVDLTEALAAEAGVPEESSQGAESVLVEDVADGDEADGIEMVDDTQAATLRELAATQARLAKAEGRNEAFNQLEGLFGKLAEQLSTPTKTPKHDDSDDEDYDSVKHMQSPNMGRFVSYQGKKTVRMGGEPDASWFLSKPTQKYHPNQLRGVADKYKSAKGYESRLDMFEPKFKVTDPFEPFQTHILETLEKNGMQQHAYLRDPKDKNKVINVVEHPHLIARELSLVKTEADYFGKRFDEWDEENDTNFREILLGSIDKDLRKKVASLDNRHERAIITWIRIVREIKVMTPEEEEAIKARIEAADIKSFPGMDIKLAVEYLKPLCNQLVESNAYDPKYLLKFLRTLPTCLPVESPFYNQLLEGAR